MGHFLDILKHKLVNLKLESKMVLSTFSINVILIGTFLLLGLHFVTTQYDNLLYQSMLSSSSLIAYEFSNRFDNMITFSNILRADNTVQSTLDSVKHPPVGYSSNAHYYSQLYAALQKNYQVYQTEYTSFAAISCPRFVSYTYGYLNQHPSDEVLTNLVMQAEEADGSAKWVTDYKENNELYLVREIKKIANLSLENLGTFILKIDMNAFMEEVSNISAEYKDSYWILYDENGLFYASNSLSEKDLLFIDQNIATYGIVPVNGKKYFAVRSNTKINEWSYIHLVSYEEIASSQKSTKELYLIGLLIVFIASVFLTHILISRITRHFDLLIDKMKNFSHNSEYPQPSLYDYSGRDDEIGMLHRQFDKMAERITTLVLNNYKKEILMKEAQLKSLESQINPHFLYNTLDSVNWRAKAIGEKQISQIVESLAHFLRMTLNRKSDTFSLREEIAIIQYYMNIQQLRFDNRLNFTIDISENFQNAKIPKLSIQPLVENAVHYALEEITEECFIHVSATLCNNILTIYVKNTGSEMPEQLLQQLRDKTLLEHGLGIALLNIEERIQLMFGMQYGLDFYNEEDYAIAKMVIPYTPIV